MINENEIKEIILPQYRVRKGLDGIVHINHVAYFGRLISEVSCPENLTEVLLGCYLHDIGRGHIEINKDHGYAGAVISRRIIDNSFSNLEIDIDRLIYAVGEHNKGKTTEDIVVGSIWDADRISLFRVKKVPNPILLSTKSAIELIPYAEKYIKDHMEEYFNNY